MAGPTDKPRRLPINAHRAVRLAIAGIILTITETVLTVLDRDSLRRRIQQDNPTSNNVETLTDIATLSGALTGIVAIMLWIQLIVAIRQGGNWRNAITWVLAGVVALLAGGTLTDLTPTLAAILAGGWGILTIAVIALLAVRLFVKPT